MATTPTHPVSSFVILLNRLSLGVYFAIAGYNKIFNVGVTAFYENAFKPSAPRWLPDFAAAAYGYSLPFLELIAGALLAIGLLTRFAALAMVLMLASFMLALGIEDGSRPYHANVVFCTLAFMLMMIGPGGFSVDHYLWSRNIARITRKAKG
jgi:putative oxidoreductase